MDSYAKAISRFGIGLVVCTLWPIASIHAETLPGHEAPVIGIGWFWDDDPQDCFKSKATNCNNRSCLDALFKACKYKFSFERYKKSLGKCIFGHLYLIRNKWSVRAILKGCTINLTAKNSFDRSFGGCIAGQAGQTYDIDTYRVTIRVCREAVKNNMRLYPESY